MKRSRKYVALLVSMALVIGSFSSLAFADEAEAEQGVEQQEVEQQVEEEVVTETPDADPDGDAEEPEVAEEPGVSEEIAEEEEDAAADETEELVDTAEVTTLQAVAIPDDGEGDDEEEDEDEPRTILIGAGVFYRNDDYIDFGAEGVYTRLDDVDSISDAHIKGVFKLIYVDYTDAYGEQMFILEGANEDSLIKGEDYSSTLEWVFINTDYSTTPWGVMISGGDGTEASPFTFANVVDLNLPGYGQEYTEGEGETWKSDDNDGLTFRVADPTAQDDEYLYDLHESVLVDGIVVNPSNYSRDKGSLIIKINSDFLKTLDEGKHSVTIVFKDGDDRGAIDSTFNVVKVPQKAADKSSAQTGEYAGTIVLIASAIFVAAGAAFVVKAKKA